MTLAQVRLPLLPELIEELLIGSALGGCLLQWAVPSQLRDAEYFLLVELLITQHNAVPIGLLRAGGSTSSPLPYVLTNPPSTTRLALDDHVFVVARAENEPIDAPLEAAH